MTSVMKANDMKWIIDDVRLPPRRRQAIVWEKGGVGGIKG